jgi:hypothetical protein
MKSILRDEWEVLDVNDQVVGMLFEDSMGMAMLRRLLLGSLLPQNYDITVRDQRVADLKQRFNPFRYELDLDFSFDPAKTLDRRVGLAAGFCWRRSKENRVNTTSTCFNGFSPIKISPFMSPL